MANWKKLIYSGSDAFVNDVSASSIFLSGIGDVSQSLASALAGGTLWQPVQNGTGVALLDSNDSVGIGTTEPATKLEVYSTDDNYIRITNSEDLNVGLSLKQQSKEWILRSNANNDFQIRDVNNNAQRFHIDGPTGAIGIGTEVPAYKLHIFDSGSDDFQLNIYQTGSRTDAALRGSAGIRLESRNEYNQVGFIKINDTGLNIGTTDNESIIFQTGNTERVRILRDTGYVGIGTTSPYTELDLVGTASFGDTTDGLMIYRRGDVGYIEGIDKDRTGNNAIQIAANSSTTSPNLHLDTAGNVGIGTTTPNQKFEVKSGNINIQNADGGFLSFNNGDANITIHYNGDGRDLSFKTYDGSSNSERMRIDKDGKVGIGTTNPGHALHVNGTSEEVAIKIGSATVSPASLYFQNSEGSFRIVNDGNTLDFFDDDVDESRLRISTAGNVGIGTTNPGGMFDVHNKSNTASIILDYAASAVNGVTIQAAEGGGGWARAYNFSTGSIKRWGGFGGYGGKGTFNYWYIGAAYDNNAMTLLSGSGNVGIGTNTPGTKLVVDGITTSNKGFRTDTSNTEYSLITRDNNSHVALYVQKAGSATSEPIADFQYGDTAANSGTTVLYVAKDKSYFDNAKLGIGTTSPTYKLEVHSNNSLLLSGSGDVKFRIDKAGAKKYDIVNEGNRLTIQDGDSGQSYFGIGNTGGAIVASSSAYYTANVSNDKLLVEGKVGIGTTNPSNKLQVQGEEQHVSGDVTHLDGLVDLYNDWESNVAEKGAILTFSDNYEDSSGFQKTTRAAIKGGTQTAGNIANGFLAFYTDASTANTMPERMRIDKDGKVGIGTSSPGEALEVVGNISASGRISASAIRIENDAQIAGDLGIGGVIFGLDGFGVTIDDVAITSGSTSFGSGSNPADTTHIRTGSLSITGSQLEVVDGNLVMDGGKVLIGTPTSLHASADLQIQGSSSNFARIMLKDRDTTNANAFIDKTGATLRLTSQDDTSHGNVSLSTFDGTDTMDRLYVKSDGNVGIGTTSPTKPLTVQGDISASGNILLGGGGIIEAPSVNGSEDLIFKAAGHVHIEIDSNGNAADDRTFRIYKHDISGTPLFEVHEANGVTMYNNVTASGNISASGTITANSFTGDGSNLSGVLTNHLWYDGTTYLSSSVDVQIKAGKQLLLESGTDKTGSISILAADREHIFSTFNDSATGNPRQFSIKHRLGATELINRRGNLILSASGNIGVGTHDPTDKLTITDGNILVQSANYVQVKVDQTDSGQATLGVSSGTGTAFIKTETNNDAYDADIRFLVSGSSTTGTQERMRIKEDGKVGIGTALPNKTLDVVGSIQASNNIGNLVTGVSGQVLEDGDSTLSTLRFDSDRWRVWAGGSERLTVVSASGNVGVGIYNPSEKLSVAGNIELTTGADRRIYMGGQASTTFGIAYNSSNPDYGIFYTEGSPDKVNISPNGNATAGVMTLEGDGNVGIGTSNPQARLHVAGGDAYRTMQLSGPTPGIWFEDTNSGADDWHVGANGGTLYFLRDSDNNGVYNNIAGYFNSSDEFIIHSSTGKIGIGEANPAGKLHISSTGTDFITLDRTADANVDQVINLFPSYDGANNTSLRIDIGTAQFQFTENERLGIGTVSPADTLEVVGGIRAENAVLTQGPDTPADGHVALGESGDVLRIKSMHGYVDVGPKNTSWCHFYTNMPRFYFDREITIDNPSGGDAIISSYDTNLILRRHYGDADYNQIKIADDSLEILLSNDNRLSIDGAGKLTLGAYGSGTHTGTLTKSLGVDSSGNVIEFTAAAVYTDAEAVSAVSTADNYLKNDAADTATGLLTLNGGIEVLSGTGGGKLRIKRNTYSTDGDDIVDIHLDDSVIYFDIDNDNDSDGSYFTFRYKAAGSFSNLLAFSKDGITYKGSTIWHASNDGAGSGLDADTLDGNHASAFLTAHPNISAAGTSNNSGNTFIQDITLDSNGHVTGLSTGTAAAGVDSVGTGLDISGDLSTISLDLTEVTANNSTVNAVLTNDGDGTFTAEPNLTFDGSTLSVASTVSATNFLGTNYGHTGDSDTKLAFTTDSFQLLAGSVNMLQGNEASTDELVVNENSTAMDFRVESNTNENMLFVDGGENRVGIGLGVPKAIMHIENTDNSVAATTNTFSDFQLLLKNLSNNANTFAGIAFDCSSETDVDAMSAAIKVINVNTDSTLHDAHMTFLTNDESDDDIRERMRITNTGNIGMGTTSPNTTLHVVKNDVTDSGVVQIESDEGTIDTGDRLLILNFQNDSSIGSQNDYIQFKAGGSEVGRIHSEVSYGTFTGCHVSQRPSGSDFSNWKTGMIVKSTGNIIATGSTIGLAWPEVDITTTQKDKSVMGVWHENTPAGHEVKHLDRTLPTINYNALGEGMLLVTDTNGDIEVGDYICSSTRLGHGEKQDDDLMHNYTVAKATQACSFASASIDSDLGFKSMLIACTYHCG